MVLVALVATAILGMGADFNGASNAVLPQNPLAGEELSRQRALLKQLSEEKGSAADSQLVGWMNRMDRGSVDPSLKLDVLAAAEKRSGEQVSRVLKALRSKLAEDSQLGEFQVVLHGGDPEAGRKVFYEKQEAACMRCHRISGNGGEVGPDLSRIGKGKTRSQILEEILYPDRVISEGFETVIIEMRSGRFHAGFVKNETDLELVVDSPEDGLVRVAKAEIKSRQKGPSAMPPQMGLSLTRNDLRDLVEFLARLK